jgi:hypothetical protein
MKGLHSRSLILGLLLLAASGCQSATSPAPQPQPPVPMPEPGPPAGPTSPLNYASIVGVYDLAETITGFDPVWGDLTGHRFTAVLTLAEGVGTFNDLRLLSAEGKTVEGPPRDGSVTWATSARPGTLMLDLGRNHNIVLVEIDEPDNNQMASPRFAGVINVAFTSAGRSSPREERHRTPQCPAPEAEGPKGRPSPATASDH